MMKKSIRPRLTIEQRGDALTVKGIPFEIASQLVATVAASSAVRSDGSLFRGVDGPVTNAHLRHVIRAWGQRVGAVVFEVSDGGAA